MECHPRLGDFEPRKQAQGITAALFARITLAPASITAADTQKLNAAGWDDASIFYTISACALFNFYNRWILASGVNPVSEEAFQKSGREMAAAGYAPPDTTPSASLCIHCELLPVKGSEL